MFSKYVLYPILMRHRQNVGGGGDDEICIEQIDK